jgi:hypothetical protein
MRCPCCEGVCPLAAPKSEVPTGADQLGGSTAPTFFYFLKLPEHFKTHVTTEMASSAMKSVLLLAMLLCTLAVAAASTAEASHILVKDEAKLLELKESITTAADTFTKFKVRPDISSSLLEGGTPAAQRMAGPVGAVSRRRPGLHAERETVLHSESLRIPACRGSHRVFSIQGGGMLALRVLSAWRAR